MNATPQQYWFNFIVHVTVLNDLLSLLSSDYNSDTNIKQTIQTKRCFIYSILSSERNEKCIDFTMMFFSVNTFSGSKTDPIFTYYNTTIG